MTETPIDRAFAAMQEAEEDGGARLRFYERLADAELFVMLSKEPDGDVVEPEIFVVEGRRFVLAFDREDRLSGFAGRAVPYAALSGRALAALLRSEDLGLGLNLEVAPSSILLPSAAIEWLGETLDRGPAETEARPERVAAPRDLPQALLSALDTKLATAAGRARSAYLAAVVYEGGARGHLLGFTGTQPGAEPALARAINEALVFSGLEAGALDVAFLDDSDRLTAELARVALRFDLPELADPVRSAPVAPGTDPTKPPILR